MSKTDEPRGEAVPPEGEVDPDAPGHDDEEAEADEIEEAARREAEEADELGEAHGAYIAAVLDHFGPDAPVYPCPTCEARGYTLAALKADETVHRCESCGGLGETVTGSMVAGQERRPCSRCHGNGWVEEFGQPVVEPPAAAAQSWEPLPEAAFVPINVEPVPLGQAS